MTRAFIYAGAPTVISSLWSVDDQATGVLMNSFYQHLKRGDSKAAALRAAQAETRERYPHPYFWAAFVLTGDPGLAPSPAPVLPLALAEALGAVAAGGLALALVMSRRRKRQV